KTAALPGRIVHALVFFARPRNQTVGSSAGVHVRSAGTSSVARPTSTVVGCARDSIVSWRGIWKRTESPWFKTLANGALSAGPFPSAIEADFATSLRSTPL